MREQVQQYRNAPFEEGMDQPGQRLLTVTGKVWNVGYCYHVASPYKMLCYYDQFKSHYDAEITEI